MPKGASLDEEINSANIGCLIVLIFVECGFTGDNAICADGVYDNDIK